MKKYLVLLLFSALSSVSFAQDAPAEIKIDTAILKTFAGKFTFSSTFQQCVFEYKNGDLHAEVDSYGQNRIFAIGEDRFKSTSSYGTEFTFLRDANKKITGVRLALMGQELEGTKE
jgi:hypothetical protein